VVNEREIIMKGIAVLEEKRERAATKELERCSKRSNFKVLLPTIEKTNSCLCMHVRSERDLESFSHTSISFRVTSYKLCKTASATSLVSTAKYVRLVNTKFGRFFSCWNICLEDIQMVRCGTGVCDAIIFT
jgi:hypothetical protein